jgi:DNA-binding transcriptional ArsR family regulator
MRATARLALSLALRESGLATKRGGDLVAEPPDGNTLLFEVVPASIVDGPRARTLIDATPVSAVVVADLITAEGRAILDARHVSWLDRRGHLKIMAPGVWIDRDVGPIPRRVAASRPNQPISGAAAIGVAAGHLIDAERFGGVRSVATMLGLSPSAVSQARTALKAAGMLGSDREGRLALFAELCEAWHPMWIDLRRTPSSDEPVVASGTLAATALGAPIVATTRYPIELYSLGVGQLERLRLRAGTGPSKVVARVAVAPTPLVCAVESPSNAVVRGFKVAHPLFVALDLAADPARGSEALSQWEPEGWPRAW